MLISNIGKVFFLLVGPIDFSWSGFPDGAIVLAVLPPAKSTIRGRRLPLVCRLAGGAPLEFCKIAYCASAARLKTQVCNCVRFYCHFKDQCRNSEIHRG